MAPQTDRTQYHGSNVENHGGNIRLSKDQPQKDKQINIPPSVLTALGAFLIILSIAGGEEEFPAIFPGILLLILGRITASKQKQKKESAPKPVRPERPLKPSSAQTIREERIRRQKMLKNEEKRQKETIREKEESSLSSSATYREHYPHKEKPQKPIDWEHYGEHVGPTKEKRLEQAKQLLDAGLMDREEYLEKCREIKNS